MKNFKSTLRFPITRECLCDINNSRAIAGLIGVRIERERGLGGKPRATTGCARARGYILAHSAARKLCAFNKVDKERWRDFRVSGQDNIFRHYIITWSGKRHRVFIARTLLLSRRARDTQPRRYVTEVSAVTR